MTTLDIQIIDAFAEGPFTGNPAAVVLLEARQPEAWMQNVAMEMNQAETAFLLWENAGWSLRWFTPVAEVDLCGHATLASAHFLWQEGHASTDAPILFHTKSGILTAERGSTGEITLDFPAITSLPVEPPADLLEALGVAPHTILRGDFDLLCVLETPEAVRAIEPDHSIVTQWNVRGLLVTARGGAPGVDFISRCFFPALGVTEDPVTGSAHCALAPYWRGVLGKDCLTGLQASKRGGIVGCAVVGNRVKLTGKARTTLRGQLDS